jgi:hypothetical protein
MLHAAKGPHSTSPQIPNTQAYSASILLTSLFRAISANTRTRWRSVSWWAGGSDRTTRLMSRSWCAGSLSFEMILRGAGNG